MSIFDIVLLGAALSMDAAAVGMANGMAEPRMSRKKTFLIALFFGVFQGGMPLLGYYGSSVFSSLVGRIAPYLSFMLLLFLGGKMLRRGCVFPRSPRRPSQLLSTRSPSAFPSWRRRRRVLFRSACRSAPSSSPRPPSFCRLPPCRWGNSRAINFRAGRKSLAGSCSFSSASNCCLKHFEGVLSACLDKMPSLCYTVNGNISRTRE